MTVNTIKIVGQVLPPTGVPDTRSRVFFVMTGYDTDADDYAVIYPVPGRDDEDGFPIASDGTIDVDLWPNQEGERNTLYRVEVQVHQLNRPVRVPIASISVPNTGGPYNLNDLLGVEPPPDATVEEYIAELAAAAAAAEAAADRAETAAAGILGPFASRSEFVTWAGSNTADDGVIASDGTVQYVASAGATAIPDLLGWLPFGSIHVKHFGAVGDGVADDTTSIQSSLDYARVRGGINGERVFTGAGRFRISTVSLSDGVVIEGEGERTTRFEKADPEDFSFMFESENFEADLAANDFAYSVSSSLNTGFRNCGFYGVKLYPDTNVTGEAIIANVIDAAGHFEMVIDGGGTATSITGGVKGQALKLVRGDTNLTVNIGGTDAINKTLTDADPYLFLTYTGTEWRLTSEISRIAGGIRLYTRRPIMDNVQVFNVLGSGIWLAGPDDGGSTNANEMPEGYIGPLYCYRTSAEGVIVSGFHDAIIKSVNVGSSKFTGLLCERKTGESSCTGEILHAHIYGGDYIGIDVQGPMHFGECIAESNAHIGCLVDYKHNTATGPTWFSTLQVYSNCSDNDIGVNSYRQVAFDEPNCVVGKFLASPAGSNADNVYALDVTANRAQVHGINIVGNSTTYGIRNSGNYNQFTGVVNGCARGLSFAGGGYCSYRLQLQSCDTQLYNLGGDFTHSTFDVSFFTGAGGATWGGALPTVSQRLNTDLHIKGKIDTTDVRSKFSGKATIDLSAGPGEQKVTLTHGLWYTPDISEISFGMMWAGGNFNFTTDGTTAVLGPYTDDIQPTTLTLALYAPVTQASTVDVSVQVG